jgi:hypothetical protein
MFLLRLGALILMTILVVRFCFLVFVCFVVLGLELRAFTPRHSTSSIFVMGFFEIGSHELFAQAGFLLISTS